MRVELFAGRRGCGWSWRVIQAETESRKLLGRKWIGVIIDIYVHVFSFDF
jgi:hypothetical protein